MSSVKSNRNITSFDSLSIYAYSYQEQIHELYSKLCCKQ